MKLFLLLSTPFVVTFFGSTFSSNVSQSCAHQCGTVSQEIGLPCHCDLFCNAVRDCCLDFQQECPELHAESLTIDAYRSEDSTAAIYKCPMNYNDTIGIMDLCEDDSIETIDTASLQFLSRVHVYNKATRVLFKNAFCSHCWGYTDWSDLIFPVIIPSDTESDLHYLRRYVVSFMDSLQEEYPRKKYEDSLVANCDWSPLAEESGLFEEMLQLDFYCDSQFTNKFEPVAVIATSKNTSSPQIGNATDETRHNVEMLCVARNKDCMDSFLEPFNKSHMVLAGFELIVKYDNLQDLSTFHAGVGAGFGGDPLGNVESTY